MKANELRIGNWVQELGIESQIQRAHISYSNNYKEWGGNIPKWKPIPLTEEWLEKFGFEFEPINKLYKIGYNRCIKHYFAVWIMFQSNETPPSLNQTTSIGEFKYVHQFQNLYFALTNTELEVK